MRFNLIIIICCALIWMCSCNSSKSTKTALEDTTSSLKETTSSTLSSTVTKAEKTTKEVKSKLVEKENEAETKLEENTKEAKEVVRSKMEKAESNAPTKSPVKQVKVKDIETSKTKAAASQKMQEQQVALVGKYKWLKRVCCGRMQKVTLPEEGEETYMTFTEDGKVLYSGTALKNAENCEYTLDMNFRSFPDRPMLKMGTKIAALMHHLGDTLVIDRGYIDLDKNYWLKVE